MDNKSKVSSGSKQLSCSPNSVSDSAVTARYPSSGDTTKELVKLRGLSETTKDEGICKAVRQTLLEMDAGQSKDVWAPSKAASNARFVELLCNAFGHPVVPFHCIRGHQALSASQSEESGATDDNCGGGAGGLIISLFLGRLVFDSSERFLMK